MIEVSGLNTRKASYVVEIEGGVFNSPSARLVTDLTMELCKTSACTSSNLIQTIVIQPFRFEPNTIAEDQITVLGDKKTNGDETVKLYLTAELDNPISAEG